MTNSTEIDLVELTVERVQTGFASSAFTCESLTQAFLDRIAVYNAHYNAITFLNPDALETARSIDRRRAAGETLGPLAGVPVVVKDTMDMKGFPTTGGWSLLTSKKGGVDLYPGTDAPVVLSAAGLHLGDRVVFTGDMATPRASLEALALESGLRVTSGVSRKTTLVVAADPHSQSGKARSARENHVRMVSEQVFLQLCKHVAPTERVKPATT